MKKLLLTMSAAAIMALSSCTTVSHTASTLGVESSVFNLTVADMKVDTVKAEQTTNWKWNPFNTVSVKGVKDNACAELLKAEKADVLVEPQYTVHRRGLFRGGSVTVSGYPARYRNFRPMTQSDADVVATLEGYGPNQRLASTYQVIGTSGRQGWKKASKKMFKPKGRYSLDLSEGKRTQFVDLMGGGLIDGDGEMNGGHAGVLYGNHGKRWGWYGRAAVNWNSYDDYYGEISRSGFVAAIGFIKTIGKHWNYLMGVGCGSGFNTRYHYGYYNGFVEMGREAQGLVDIMFQYKVSRINILAGTTVSAGRSWTNGTLNVGIGYNF